MQVHEQARCWTVRYTVPKQVMYADGKERTLPSNKCSTVITMSAVTAITETLLAYPDATIVSVNPGPAGPVLIGNGTVIRDEKAAE